MHDLVIRNGSIVDGSGAPAFTGDVAIDGDRISSVGTRAGPGRREFNAEGKIVAPGWVDIHTHYDGQAMWDPYLSPSHLHGVSTVVMGHCGVGFAPVREAHRELMIGVMEGLEDIPGATLRAGLNWSWESFPDYLKVLETMPRVMDIATQVPHSALRIYAMGARGAHKDPATAADIETMASLVEEALRAGALGFSTSRTKLHNTADGHHIPGSFASKEELEGIAAGMARAGHGVFQFFSDMDAIEQEFEWMEQIGGAQQVPVHFTVAQFDRSDRYRQLLNRTAQANARGANICALVACRPVGMLMTLDSDKHPFAYHPSYAAIRHLPLSERVRLMRNVDLRQRILEEASTDTNGFWRARMSEFEGMFRLGSPPNYEPELSQSIAAIAARGQCSASEVAYESLLEEEGRAVLYFPFFSYVEGDFAALAEMMLHPNSLLSLADGGAHCGIMCDASMPTFLLSHWVRDRTRGPRIALEQAVRMQTALTAKSYGLLDRGQLKVGLKADLNVIDLPRLNLGNPYTVQDLPAEGRRFMQSATGYYLSLVSGVVTVQDGKVTGALPGKLIRGPKRAS